MKIIEHTSYQRVELPNGTVHLIPIPHMQVIRESTQLKHTKTKRQPKDLLQKIDKKTRMLITGFVVAAILGLAATAHPITIIDAQIPTSSTECQLDHSQPPYITKWETEIESACQDTGVPANLLGALIDVESDGNPKAISKDWACGLTQVVSNSNMLTNEYGERYFADRPACQQLINDPQFAVLEGAHLLRNHYNHKGNWRDALFAYGPEGVGYSYADEVLEKYQKYNK